MESKDNHLDKKKKRLESLQILIGKNSDQSKKQRFIWLIAVLKGDLKLLRLIKQEKIAAFFLSRTLVSLKAKLLSSAKRINLIWRFCSLGKTYQC